MDGELERTKKLLRRQSGGVASIKSQFTRANSTEGQSQDTKQTTRPRDLAATAGAASVRDRWIKMAANSQDSQDSQPSTLERPRRKKPEDNPQGVLRRYNPGVKEEKEGKIPEKVSLTDLPERDLFDPEAMKEREELKKQFEEDEQKKLERRKEREALLKKLDENSEQVHKAEQEMNRKRFEEEKKKKESSKKRAEDSPKPVTTPTAETKRNFFIPSRSVEEVSQDKKAKEEDITGGNDHEDDASVKKAYLESRIPPLDIDGLNYDKLLEKAQELYESVYELEDQKIDFQSRIKQQQRDIMELKERANQKQVQSIPPPPPTVTPLKTAPGVGKLSERFSSNAPPKVQVSSPYLGDPFAKISDGKSFSDKFKMFESMAKK